MNEKNGKNPLIALSVATVLFAALGVIVYTQAPLKGIRPSVPEVHEPSEKIRARLWQDPFRAVLDKAKANGKAEPVNAGILDLSKNFCSCGMKKDGTLQRDINNRLKNKEITVLGVMVFGGPYAEGTEFRLRHRYAVLSGLRRLGFVPEDSEHIGFLKIDENQISLANILPFEWVVSENQEKDVLLLWINDESFQNNPLFKLDCLFAFLRPPDEICKIKFKVIGPAGSTTLLEMLKDLQKKKEVNLCTYSPVFEIYSATATVDDLLLLHEMEGKNSNALDRDRAKNIVSQNFCSRGINFNRTICSDWELANELIDELGRRDVDLLLKSKNGDHDHKSAQNNKNKDKYGGHCDHIVIIAEWDTFYGRKLPETFVQVLKEKHNKNEQNQNLNPNDQAYLHDVKDVTWVHRFSYLRGIDGKIPGEQDGNAKEGKKNSADSKEDRDIRKWEEPLGKSQYDYLRRLTESIHRLDQKLQHAKVGQIKAIGVLGSDFYDKYLVLQALRQRYPERIFFTTDLDARYLHPASIEWTRNLVVASGFGLQLHEKLQGDVPPFRDVYQTSVFLATLQAFHHAHELLGGTSPQKPRIFEIGRRNAIDLTPGDEKEPIPANQALPVRDLPEVGWRTFILIVVFLLLLFVLFWLYYTSDASMPKSVKQYLTYDIQRFIAKKPAITLFSLLAFFLIIIICFLFYKFILKDLEQEPFILSEGVSVWPTEIIRLIAFVSSWIFFILSRRKLEKNRLNISEEFRFSNGSAGDKSKEELQDNWNRPINTDDHVNVNQAWEKYLHLGKLSNRVSWIILILIIYVGICGLIISIFGRPTSPVRGTLSWWIDRSILLITLGSFLFLTFFVFDTIMLFRRFISKFLGKQPQWYSYSLDGFVQTWTQNPDLSGWRGSVAEEGLSDWMLIRLIAKRTEVVGKLIFYPFIVWFLMFISRHHYFDNWRTPIGLAIVITMGAVLAWSCAFMLRRSAEKLRADITDRLSRKLIGAHVAEPSGKELVEQLQEVIQEVNAIRRGAFAPYLQQPVLQSLVVPLGGVGAIQLLDVLAKAM